MREKCEQNPLRGFVVSLHITYDGKKAGDADWSQLDAWLSELYDLEVLEVSLEPYLRDGGREVVMEQDDKSRITETIARGLLETRKRCKLKIIIHNEEIPWVDLVTRPQEEQMIAPPVDPEAQSTKKRLWDPANLAMISGLVAKSMMSPEATHPSHTSSLPAFHGSSNDKGVTL